MDDSIFKHKISVTVRFNEVDMLGVCNNAVYVNYIEHARLKYIKDAGLIPGGGLFADGRLFFVVRNEISYKNFAHFDDQLFIYSKISFIKNSSFGFDHLIKNSVSGNNIVEASGVIVHVDPKTKKSLDLPEDFYDKVKLYEKDVKILRDQN